jgi:LPXTG-motif cell wall-anchored protein
MYENIAVASADNAPEVYAKAPLEIRDVKSLGFTLPDTDGSLNQILSIILGILILAAAVIGFQVKKEYKLV